MLFSIRLTAAFVLPFVVVVCHAGEVKIVPGSLIRTGTGTLELKLRSGTPATTCSVSYSLAKAGARERECTIDSASQRLTLHKFGAYFLDVKQSDGSVTRLTAAAIPDNSHSAVPTTSPFAMGCYF